MSNESENTPRTSGLTMIGDDVPFRHWSLDAEQRDMLRMLAISGVAHVLLLLGMSTLAVSMPSAEIEFDASRGIALMSRIGYVEQGSDEVIDEIDPSVEVVNPGEIDNLAPEEAPTEVVEEAAEPEEALAEVEEVVEEPAPEPPPEEEPAPEPEDTAPPEPEVVAVLPPVEVAPAPDVPAAPRPPRPPRPAPAPEAEPAPAAPVDLSSLPPSQRYPEGTLNPVATDLGMWGPEGARMVVILRNDRLRRSSHRDDIETMLAALPDWRDVVGGSGLDAFDDVDAMLIASSDPRLVNRTFIAAVHRREPTDVMHRLAQGYPGGLRWQIEEGWPVGRQSQPRICPLRDDPERPCDPRMFVVPAPNLFLLTRPEFFEDLNAGAPRPTDLEFATAYATDSVGVVAELERARESQRRALEEAARQRAIEEAEAEAARLAAERAESERNNRNRRRRDRDRDEPAPAAAPEVVVPEIKPPGALVFDSGFRAPRRQYDEEPPVRSAGWVNGLLEVADFGGHEAGGPVAMASLSEISRFRIDGMGSAPEPTAVHVSAYDEADPRFALRFMFSSAADAERFVAQWPTIIDAQPMLRLIGLRSVLLNTVWTFDHNEAIGSFAIPRSTFGLMATTIGAINAARLSD